MITHILLQDAQVVPTTTDKHGDQVGGTPVDVKCRFRYITEIDRNVNREGLEASDAIIWFDPDVDIEEGSIVSVDSKYWRITRLVKASRMSGSTIEFLKAFVKAHQLV